MQHYEGPVVVDDGGDIRFFRTVDDAERYLEPWCVEYGIAAYDGCGRLLQIEPSHPRYGVTLLVPEVPQNAAEQLEGPLRRFLVAFASRVGLDEQAVRHASLAEMVQWGLAHLAQK